MSRKMSKIKEFGCPDVYIFKTETYCIQGELYMMINLLYNTTSLFGVACSITTFKILEKQFNCLILLNASFFANFIYTKNLNDLIQVKSRADNGFCNFI